MKDFQIILTYSTERISQSMNNERIILEQRLDLMYEGVIRSKGCLMDYQAPDGQWYKIPEPIEIHTIQKWKALGYELNDCQVPVAKFKIWKPYKNERSKGVVFKLAEFYSYDQVHKS